MIAILGGLGAALCWAIATLCSSRSTRMIGPTSVLAWVMIVGFVVSLPLTLVDASAAASFTMPQILGLVVNGLSYTAGLLLAYQALVIGRVSIVTPIVSTEGGVAALGSVILGEALGVPTALILGVIAIGVVLASADHRGGEVAAVNDSGRPRYRREDPAATRRSVLLAIGASVVFSVGLITSARMGADVPISWILLVSRAVGVLLIAIPLAMRGQLQLSRAALPLVLVSGLLEAIGSALYVTGAQASPATAAVLSSQFAAIAAVSAFFLFGERLARVQIAGVTAIALGVTALAIVRL